MAYRAVRDHLSRALNRKIRGAPKDERPCLSEEPTTTYEIQHMRDWRCFTRTVRAASRAEAECLCLSWEWVDGRVLAVIPAEAEVAERWQRLNKDLAEDLEHLRWGE